MRDPIRRRAGRPLDQLREPMQRVDGGTPRRCRRGARRLRRGARRLRRCLQNLRRRLQKKRRGGIHATTTSARLWAPISRNSGVVSSRSRHSSADTTASIARVACFAHGDAYVAFFVGISTGRLRRGRAPIRDSGRRVSERGAHRGVRDAPTTARLREPRVLRVEPRVFLENRATLWGFSRRTAVRFPAGAASRPPRASRSRRTSRARETRRARTRRARKSNRRTRKMNCLRAERPRTSRLARGSRRARGRLRRDRVRVARAAEFVSFARAPVRATASRTPSHASSAASTRESSSATAVISATRRASLSNPGVDEGGAVGSGSIAVECRVACVGRRARGGDGRRGPLRRRRGSPRGE